MIINNELLFGQDLRGFKLIINRLGAYSMKDGCFALTNNAVHWSLATLNTVKNDENSRGRIWQLGKLAKAWRSLNYKLE